MCVSPDNFRAQMAILRRIGRPVSLAHLVRSAEAGVSIRGMIAVTFDDGYEDVLAIAKPELERQRIPATVFLVAGNAGRPFWWDRLDRILSAATVDLPFRVPAGTSEFVWPAVGTLEELRIRLHRTLRILSETERERTLERLSNVWSPPDFADLPRALTATEARELIRGPDIEVGSHSVSHAPLVEVAPRRAREEIETSRAMLRDQLGRPIDTFSYPHGSRSPEIERMVRAAGYRSACASVQDSVHGRTDPYRLPRLWVGNHSAASFRRRTARYTGSFDGRLDLP